MKINENSLLEVEEFLKNNVKKSRYEHSLRTAKKCAELCKKFGVEEFLGYFAGIAHDICKDFSDEKMKEIALLDDKEISPFELENPSLLHGRCAKILLKEKFKIEENSVLEAVEYHTFGKKNMSSLAKILCIADKIEEGRPHVSEEYYKKIENLSLDELLLFVLQENVCYLESKSIKVASSTYELLEELKNEVKNNG